MCVAYADYVYFSNIKPDKLVKSTFKKTDCFLLSKKLTSKGHVLHQYRADFRVSYTVNNVQYTRWVSGNGLDDAFAHSPTEQEEALAQFADGGTYPCWYDPENHGLVVLVLRHNWTSTFPVMLPAVIFILTFYYFCKGVKRFFKKSWQTKSVSRKKK